MGPFSFPAKVEDKAVRRRAIDLLREKGVRLPTFAELAEPHRVPADIRSGARAPLARTILIRSTSIACIGTTTPDALASPPCRSMSSCPKR